MYSNFPKRARLETGVEMLRWVASEHRRLNRSKKSHHAAAVVFNGYMIGETVSINSGLLHAEEQAFSLFLASPLHWCLKQKEQD